MALGGINSYSRIGNSYWNYQSALSQARLQQALAKNPKVQKAVEAVNKVTSSDYSDSLDFLKSYDSTMTSLANSANALRSDNSSGVFGNLKASSSDTSVADVSARLPLRTDRDMTLDVSQIATAQKNVSAEVSASQAASGDMNFTVSSQYSPDQLNVQVGATKENGEARTNREMLEEAAKQINNQNGKVSASVEEKDGKVSLILEGKETGMGGAFEVTGQLGAASGLNTVQTAAQNAEYSVTENGRKMEYASSSNDVVIGAGRINATLKSTGSTQITTAADSDKVVGAMSDLVDNYNRAQTLLNKNMDRGSGVMRQAGNFARNLAGSKSLEMIGVTKNKDGTLSLDKDVLTKALKKDPKLTKSLISDSYGVAQTAFNRAEGAMNTSSSSLVGNDLAKANESMYADPYQFMNAFSKAGAHNLNNYYSLGMFVNYLA